MNDFLLGFVASYILGADKNPERKRKIKNICLRIFNAIKTVFAGDPDFQK